MSKKNRNKPAELSPTPEIGVPETSIEAQVEQQAEPQVETQPEAQVETQPEAQVEQAAAAPAMHPPTGMPLRQDGPTIDEYVAAGYAAEGYPPRGYAARSTKPPHRNPMGQPITYTPMQFCQPPKPGQLRP